MNATHATFCLATQKEALFYMCKKNHPSSPPEGAFAIKRDLNNKLVFGQDTGISNATERFILQTILQFVYI